MSEPTYAYLQPEIKEKWYVTLAISILILFLISIMVWAFKKYWEVNTCDLGPNVGMVFGLSSKDWTETCVTAPLEGTIAKIKEKAKKEKRDALRPLKSLLSNIHDKIKMMIIKTRVATNQLKESNKKF